MLTEILGLIGRRCDRPGPDGRALATMSPRARRRAWTDWEERNFQAMKPASSSPFSTRTSWQPVDQRNAIEGSAGASRGDHNDNRLGQVGGRRIAEDGQSDRG